MRTHRLSIVAAAFAAVMLLLGALAPRVAHADPKKDIQQKMKEAMENYDLLEYEEARKQLNSALTIAKKAKIENDPVVAQVHVRLGIVYFAGLSDPDSAKLSFLTAVQIDPKIQIDAAYKTPDLQKLLDEARSDGGGGGDGGDGGGGDAVDCGAVTGLQHTIVDTAPGGRALAIEALVAKDVNPAKVAVMFRAKGATDFIEVKMAKQGDCQYSAAIPADAMAGELVHYYVAAFNKGGKVVASKGSSGSPNIIEVQAGGGGDGGGGGAIVGDDEDPLKGGGGGGGGGRVADTGGGGGGGGDGDGNISGNVVVGGKKPTVFLSIGGGTGGGFVTGETEQAANKVECCFAPELVHLSGEIGFYASRKTSISALVRVGLPIGANRQGHATAAPAGLARIHHAFAADGTGLNVSGALGGGILRNTIKLTDAAAGDMDVDIAAMGPLLVGAGAGYLAPLSGSLRFNVEANALAGIPVVSTIGNSRLNFGVEFDLTLGLQFGF